MQLFSAPDFSDPGKIAMTNQDTLRKTVGVLGMLLPLLLYLFLLIDTGYFRPMPSLSHYYMTRSCSLFVMVVSLLAVFLIIYKGKEQIDFYLSLIAGLFALLLLLFPTDNLPPDFACPACVVTDLKDSELRTAIHFISAGIFLFTLAIMSLFLFTRSDKSKAARGVQKRKRNRVFRICGVVILACLFVILIGMKTELFGSFYEDNHLTFWMETLAIEAFGFAWFVKGEAILADKPKRKN